MLLGARFGPQKGRVAIQETGLRDCKQVSILPLACNGACAAFEEAANFSLLVSAWNDHVLRLKLLLRFK